MLRNSLWDLEQTFAGLSPSPILIHISSCLPTAVNLQYWHIQCNANPLGVHDPLQLIS